MNYGRMQATRRRLLDAGRRHWLDDNDDVDVAAHEAGHVICGWLLQLNPTSATINGGDGYGGKTCFGRAMSKMTDCDRAFAQCVVRMAGVEAERLFGGPDDGGKTDLAEARAFASSICRSEAAVDVLVKCARRTARTMLKAHLGPLIAITAALITERTLDRNQIKAIINPPDEDDDGDGEMPSAAIVPDDDAVLLRAIMPTSGQILHGSPELIHVRQAEDRRLVFYGD
jgi:ATP-dependent Zn protease